MFTVFCSPRILAVCVLMSFADLRVGRIGVAAIKDTVSSSRMVISMLH